ncbi:hypothetical protein ANCCAN_23732 [Ancylostoma caninum]|uniref:Uncharacterized protein n=1 Tax=Ancylostoma caninum TaxID=29170 RepID=A0A368FE92_ANCCA|nr:hypothetical protein ANCCAN_23732 [Ancylostoma caninum]
MTPLPLTDHHYQISTAFFSTTRIWSQCLAIFPR